MQPDRHEVLNRVSDVCADDADILLLSILRMVMAGYATGDVECWNMAYAGAERHFRPETAGRLVAGLTGLSRVMRAERRGAWHFMPLTCCRVTKDEEDVLRLLSAARDEEDMGIAHAASRVTGSPSSPHLEEAAKIVARVLAEAAGGTTAAPKTLSPSVH